MILDSIFENKVGFGKAQIVTLIFLSLIDLNDGAQLVLSSFLTPIIKSQWKLTDTQASFLASIFYVGTFFGSIISGKLSDLYGRKPIIKIGSVMQILTSFLFIFVDTFFGMSVARLLYGFSFGFTIAITTSMFAEITPSKYRGKGILLINFFVSFGKMYGVFLAYCFLDNFHEGNWRAMMIFSCLPNVIVLYGAFTYLQESPRYLIAQNRIEEACQVIEKLAYENTKFQSAVEKIVTESDKQKLREQHREVFSNRETAKLSSLFDKNYFKITIRLFTGWFAISFIYFGQLVVLPFIFGKQEKTFGSYILTVLGQLPTFFLCLYLIDNPSFGRKNSLCFFFLISAILHLLFSIYPLTIISFLCRFFMKGSFQMLYPCTTESYPTNHRTLGFGVNSAVGRLGAVLMPYIVIPLVDINIPLIFVIFMVISLFGSYASYTLPYDGVNRALDQKEQNEYKILINSH